MSLWTSLRRVFAGQAAVVNDEPGGLRLSPPSGLVSQPAPAAATEAPKRVEAPPPVQSLGEQLANAIRRVEGELSAVEWTSDFQDLLEALSDETVGHLRQLPSAAQRALAACEDENVPTSALVPIFERDPMLTEALLARANSAYYNPSGQPCFSLEAAIVRQGRRSAHAVIMQQALGGMVCRPGGAWSGMANKTWSHMVRTGPIARTVAPAFDVDPEQAMVLGLLHDVGKLVVFDRMSAMRTASRGELAMSPRAVSLALRLLHEPLGGLCAMQWNIGEDAAQTLATHHRDPAPSRPDPLSEVVWLAERIDLAEQYRHPVNLDELWTAGHLSGRADDVAEALARRAAHEKTRQTA